jgi:glycine cleavage system H protein
MTLVPQNLLYSKEHEWLRVDDSQKALCTIGITDYAQAKLGDIVVVELPKVGSRVEFMKPAANIESFKAVSEVYSPITGEVVEVNQKVVQDPGVVNRDPYGEGWLFKVRATKLEEETRLLLDANAYQKLIGEMS